MNERDDEHRRADSQGAPTPGPADGTVGIGRRVARADCAQEPDIQAASTVQRDRSLATALRKGTGARRPAARRAATALPGFAAAR
jgi:hypothetical protein